MPAMSPEQVREIAEDAAQRASEKVAENVAEKAVKATLTALGIDVTKLHEEQRVWAFARTMQQGTQRGVFALITGFGTTVAATIVGGVWYLLNKPH